MEPNGRELDFVHELPPPKRRRVLRRLRPEQCGSSSAIVLHMEVFIETFVGNMDYKDPNHEDFLTAVNFLVAMGHTISKEAQIGCAKRLLKAFTGLPPMAAEDELNKFLLPRSVQLVRNRGIDLLLIKDDYVRTCMALALDYKKLNGMSSLNQSQLKQLIKFCASGSWKEHSRQFIKTKRAADPEFGEVEEEAWMKRHLSLAKRAAVKVHRLVRRERLVAIDAIVSQVYIQNELDRSQFEDEFSCFKEIDDILWDDTKKFFLDMAPAPPNTPGADAAVAGIPQANASVPYLSGMSLESIVEEIACWCPGGFTDSFVSGAVFESTSDFVMSAISHLDIFSDEAWVTQLMPRAMIGVAFEKELKSHGFSFSSFIRKEWESNCEYAPEFAITKKILEIQKESNHGAHWMINHLKGCLRMFKKRKYQSIGTHTVFFRYYILKKKIKSDDEEISDGVHYTPITFTDVRDYACFCQNNELYLQRYLKNSLVRMVSCNS